MSGVSDAVLNESLDNSSCCELVARYGPVTICIIKSSLNTVTLPLSVHVHVTPLYSYKTQEFTVLITSFMK